MAGLFDYMQQCQRLLRDDDQRLINPADWIDWINRARRQVALQSQCIRFVPPISGQCVSVTITNGGTGYTNPTVVISGPDFPTGAQLYPMGAQAQAIATVNGGIIESVNVVFGGDGYFQPTVTITDPTGTGFTGTVQTSPINITVQGQEIYPFSKVPLGNFPGVDGIYNIRSISMIYSNWRYSCLRYAFSAEYQPHIRRYPQDYQYVPAVFAQLGQGKAGSCYLFPIANAAYQMEWDCIGSPADLISDQSVEAIPEPWTDAVPFLACYYAMLSLSNFNAGRFYKEEYDNFLGRYSAGVRVGYINNPYGRS